MPKKCEYKSDKEKVAMRLLTTVVILDRFQRLISKECKNWTKIARGIIFFPVKTEIPYFSNM